jgi:predicted metal-dependent HD superfamily phosphohydrolase
MVVVCLLPGFSQQRRWHEYPQVVEIAYWPVDVVEK